MPERAVNANYILIDYENVQPTDLTLLHEQPVHVKVFLGSHQTKIPVSLASAIQLLGSHAEYILLQSTGRNALDFHIAYYLGQLSAADPGGVFHIVSKDAGFDPLIKHLTKKGMAVQRYPRLCDIPFCKGSAPPEDSSRLRLVLSDLIRRKASKPRTEKTLRSTIAALFKKELTDAELDGLFQSLCERGIVKLEDGKVTYELPASP